MLVLLFLSHFTLAGDFTCSEKLEYQLGDAIHYAPIVKSYSQTQVDQDPTDTLFAEIEKDFPDAPPAGIIRFHSTPAVVETFSDTSVHYRVTILVRELSTGEFCKKAADCALELKKKPHLIRKLNDLIARLNCP